MVKKAEHSKNVTFTLPVSLVEKFRGYAESKYITSINAGVREALAEYSYKIEKEVLRKEMKEASKDSLFMKDLEESMKDFEAADDEMDRGIDSW